MKVPSSKKIKGRFTISINQAKSYNLGSFFVGVPVCDWNNVEELAKHAHTLKRRNNIPVTAEWSFRCFCDSLDKIAANYIKNSDLRNFAGQLKRYLLQEEVKETYFKVFCRIKLQKENEETSAEMKTIAEISAKKLTTVAVKILSTSFTSDIAQIGIASNCSLGSGSTSSHSSIIDVDDKSVELDSHTYDANDDKFNSDSTFADDANNDAFNVDSTSADDDVTYAVIKKKIFAKAEEIHSRYLRGNKITPDERKLMSCGSSLVLDLVDNDNNEFKKLFSAASWELVKSYFESKLVLPQSAIAQDLFEKWEFGAGLALLGNDFDDAYDYFGFIGCAKDMSRKSKRMISLFRTIFECVHYNPYLMNQQYPQNISENDYVDQVWLPILKSLFAINGNIIRLKKGETTTEESSDNKNNLYSNDKNIISFKIDIRFIYDYYEHEFDIGAIEACLPQADDEKVTDDESKLLREGKDNAEGIFKVLGGDCSRSWIAQISGLKAYFSTVNYVSYDLNVGVLQDEIILPTSIAALNDSRNCLNMMNALLKFRDDVEQIAHKIQDKVTLTTKKNDTTAAKFHVQRSSSPSRNKVPEAQTWYTPPRANCTRSVFTSLNSDLLDSGATSRLENIANNRTSLNVDSNPPTFRTEDKHGFTRTVNGFYCTKFKKTFKSHPYA